ncbi:FixH family protein [Nisaea acidiphila]|uniref:FixH family protein n=1 Tax=Nisaea acidiphila TaxID=1862145 RepID=A0A9J7ASK1_9PROT|nr:FixH family protein [Nisaea acidiphila]UUX50320.1 FixH family protein [Nisaea acidiphila]
MSDLAMTEPARLKGKHVLFTLLGFFGVVIAVNVTFVVIALDTWTGLTTPKSYVEGLNYNSLIEDATKQRALGWTADIAVARDPGKPDSFAVTVTASLGDRNGKPLAAESVTLSFRHPINEKYDQTIALTRGADGRYTGAAELPVAGNWDTRMTARMADGSSFRRDGELWIK